MMLLLPACLAGMALASIESSHINSGKSCLSSLPSSGMASRHIKAHSDDFLLMRGCIKTSTVLGATIQRTFRRVSEFVPADRSLR